MALIFNLPSQIVVQTAAQWAADSTVYSAKRILVTSDAFYGSTDQRKWKLADGVQTWSNLDYMIEGAFQPLDADLTAIAALAGTSGYLKKTAANTWALQSNTSLTSDITSAGIMAKTLAGGIFTGGVLSSFDTIIEAFQNIDSQVGDLSTALIVGSFDGTGGTTMPTGTIIVGGTGGSPNNVALTLSGTGGTFALSGAGVLTMPNAATATRGLLTSTDWNTFNGKQDALVSATNIKTINGSSILGSGDLSIGGALVIGTSTITSGTNTRILYNNSGVVGEYTLTGTGTVVPMATSPTFVTSTATTAITATTAAADVMQTFTNNSSGTPAANYGLSIAYKLKSSTTDSQDAANEIFYWQTATHATRKAAYKMQLSNNGTMTDVFKIESSGSQIEHFIISASGTYATLRLYSGTSQKGSLDAFTDMYLSTWAAAGSKIYFRAGVASSGMNLSTTALTFDNAVDLVFNTSTGSKLGTATTQKIALWNKTPIVQPTTAIAGATYVSGGGGAITRTDTFGGYTIEQFFQAAINFGLLA